MTCGMCGFEFDAEEAERSCSGCPLTSSCGLIRCPRCGYEMPPEAQLVRWLRGLATGIRQRAAGSGQRATGSRQQATGSGQQATGSRRVNGNGEE